MNKDNVFARLDDLSAKLNRTSDAISDALKQVEAKLATLRLGVEVWMEEPLETSPVPDQQDNVQDVVSFYLGYAKVKGTWHLAMKSTWLRYVADAPAELEEPVSIHQATREMRIAALKCLPELLNALEKKAKEQLYQIQKSLDHLSIAIEDMVQTNPKP